MTKNQLKKLYTEYVEEVLKTANCYEGLEYFETITIHDIYTIADKEKYSEWVDSRAICDDLTTYNLYGEEVPSNDQLFVKASHFVKSAKDLCEEMIEDHSLTNDIEFSFENFDIFFTEGDGSFVMSVDTMNESIVKSLSVDGLKQLGRAIIESVG